MSSHNTLCGSHREHPLHSVPVGKPASDEIVYLTLLLRRCKAAPSPDSLERPLSHEELAELHGADPADIRAVEAFACEQQFSVVSVNPASRAIMISGPLSDLADVFGADVEMRRVGERAIRTRQAELHLPEALADRVIAILGFDERPIAGTHHYFRPESARSTSYTPPQVAKLYNFPTGTGKNQTIALIELGGGFKSSDLQKYWKQLGLHTVSVTAVSVNGAQNSPTGNPDSADGEVVLDIEVAGGVAPDARIAVYFAPNTDQGFLNAINAAIHDKVRKPSVISISWGAAESEWTRQALNAFDAAFHDAALLGISVCAAAGDSGSSDGESDGRDHVDFPASSSWVLACGGTTLVAQNGKIQSETVWNDGTNGGATGGGVSGVFSRPSYQANVNIPVATGSTNQAGRGVPDVAGVADPETGYTILVDGQHGVIGGTSAVAPLWAGLISLFNEQLGKNVGWFQPTLYGTLSQYKALRDVTSGANGDFRAAAGWDACTGLGSPNGQAMLGLLKTSTKK